MLQTRLQLIFREVFEDDSLILADDLSQQTYGDWDSFHQVKLVIAIEEEFGIKFSTDEVVSNTSVAGIREVLLAKGVAG
jgi:acyl carrier protein